MWGVRARQARHGPKMHGARGRKGYVIGSIGRCVGAEERWKVCRGGRHGGGEKFCVQLLHAAKGGRYAMAELQGKEGRWLGVG